MRAYLFPTDTAWASYLRAHPELDEANFWLPSAVVPFRALSPGEPLLFKSKAAAGGRLIGGGMFVGYHQLRVSEAWRIYGTGNGTDDPDQFRDAINRYRLRNHQPAEHDPLIGCILLSEVFFVPPAAELPPPPDWPQAAVRGKGFRAEDPEWSYVETALTELLRAASWPTDRPAPDFVSYVGGPTRGEPRLVVPRIGQKGFKASVLTSYHRRCAITGAKITPTLQAAHIRPVSEQGEHRIDNGLLLRSDVHTLFDEGYLGVDEKYRLQVSPALRRDWGNGKEFYDRAGTQIDLPDRVPDRPDREAVTWHMDTIFRAS